MAVSLTVTTLDEALKALEACGHASVRALNTKNGAPDNQFGVRMGDIRAIAKSIKTNHELGRELWATGNVDAMFLATLIMKPKLLPEEEVERMAASVTFSQARFGQSALADWLMTNIIRQHPSKEALRQRWMESSQPMLARAGWSLTAARIAQAPEGLDPAALLDRIEWEMAGAPSAVQWTMNGCLAEIGIHFAELRPRALDIGERLGIFRDYPCSKGCTSPFAPIWINFMVARQA